MVAVNPAWIDSVALDAFRLRRIDSLMVMSNGLDPLGARTGILPGSNSFNVTVSGTTITVGTGITSLYYAGQGTYRIAITAASTLTLDAPHATLPRVDLVYLRVWDNSVDASGLNKADVVYLAGTPSSSPSAPTPPGTQIYMRLAHITVPASGGGAPTVNTTVRPVTVAAGGILPTTTAPSTPYTGQYYDDGTTLWRWDGSAWKGINPLLPSSSEQISFPSSPATGSFTDFTAAQWPPLTVIVPPSGMLKITIGAACLNTNTATSTAWCRWRSSGGLTESATDTNSVSTIGSRVYASRTVLRKGLTPGASVTLTPQYNVSSYNSGATSVTGGQLIVEPIAG
ncbi:hypothetical protein [Streptomyces sp. NPDC001508]|uniref:hypothetical protein n=1 Tax=Streptomyces sp. NPDC001508 TaxID=3154656 RepID=UPI00332949DD